MKTLDHTPEKIFIGVSWPYANGDIHIGHLAGQNVVCDVFARYHRLKGNKVLMVSGSDSHGSGVIFKAEELKTDPAKYSEESHKKIVETFNKLGFLYENFTKTATDNHKKIVQNIFLVLKELGYLEVKKSEQYYDRKVKRFLPDRFVKGICPNCEAENARGDECPECGAFLKPEDLINPYSTLSDSKPLMKKTEHYYLDLTKLQNQITQWIKENDEDWRKWVKEFTRGWIKQGLEPRAVTRDFTFGVKVPIEGWENKVIYVWIEAVVGYLSAAIEWAEKRNLPSSWQDFWKDPNCKHYYFIAGGNVPFHTIVWPAEIIAYNEKYKNEELNHKYKLPGETTSEPLNLPFNIPANKMLLFKGKKMSKGDSTGIAVSDLLTKYSPDVIRYFFVKYAPENHDREFIWKDFIDSNNNELVANIGNFINRVLTFVHSRFNGVVPEGQLKDDVLESINKAFSDTSRYLEKTQFIKAIESILELGKFANKYFNDSEPWMKIKEDTDEAGDIIYNSIQIVNALRILLKPFTPFAMERLKGYLNISNEYDPNLELEKTGGVGEYLNKWTFDRIEKGQRLNKSEVLFEKLEYTEDLQLLDNRKVEDVKTDTTLTQDRSTREIPVIWETVHNLKIQKKKRLVNEWIKKVEDRIREKYGGDKNWKERDEFKGYKELHKRYSTEEFQPSSEKLVEFVLKKGSLPNINTFVDIYNAISALTGVSIGAHDIAKISGDPKLTILEKSIEFLTITGKRKEKAKKNEYGYVDEEGILCRLDVQQSARSKVTEKSSNILVILQGHKYLEKEELKEALNLLNEGIKLLDN